MKIMKQCECVLAWQIRVLDAEWDAGGAAAVTQHSVVCMCPLAGSPLVWAGSPPGSVRVTASRVSSLIVHNQIDSPGLAASWPATTCSAAAGGGCGSGRVQTPRPPRSPHQTHCSGTAKLQRCCMPPHELQPRGREWGREDGTWHGWMAQRSQGCWGGLAVVCAGLWPLHFGRPLACTTAREGGSVILIREEKVGRDV